MTDQKIIFVNIAWMTYYQGPDGDKAEGNFGYLKQNPGAPVHESWNFEPINGKIYGYVPRSAKINISRLGAKPNDDKISGITVVWLTRRPRKPKTVIVGWYKNATVHKQSKWISIRRTGGFNVGYQIEASKENAVLLSTDARTYPIPTGVKGGLGQSPIWYGANEKFNRDVLSYIERREKHSPSKTIPRQPDPELRRKVEQAAINHAIAHFESDAGGNRVVKSVEKDNVGWDLEAIGGDDEILKIEVKGLSGKELIAELTPNEYAKMVSNDHRQSYIVYIVVEALSENPNAKIFRFDGIRSKRNDYIWVSDDGEQLKIETRTGARLSIAAH